MSTATSLMKTPRRWHDRAAREFVVVASLAATAYGEESAKPARNVVEEIIVTAQRKEEAAQDVPISMSVLSSEFLASQGVTDIREAMLFAPNVKVESAGFFSAPRIRGFTVNNNNLAFEPPAGMAIDGVPYTNVAYFLAALFDIDRVEVLRGPQGTTFGK